MMYKEMKETKGILKNECAKKKEKKVRPLVIVHKRESKINRHLICKLHRERTKYRV